MNIQTSIKVAKVKKEEMPEIGKLIVDSGHDIAWTSDSQKFMMPNQSGKIVSLGNDLELRTASLEALTKSADLKDQKKKRDTFFSLMTTASTIITQRFPEVKQSVDGMEVIVASIQAFETLTDPERTGIVKPALSVSKALIEGLDILAPCIPQLNVLTPHLKTAGLLVKMGDLISQLYPQPAAAADKG